MTRHCGGCTLCCKLIPVEELHKAAGTRCKHQRSSKGCAIYERRPISCREWSCMWLIGVEGEDKHPVPISRPDRSHYVVDQVPDLVRVRDDATGKIIEELTVMQIWVDPLYPDAWQDSDLLDMLERAGVVGLIRYSSSEAFSIFPPSRTSTGKWERSRRQETSDAPDLEQARLQARFDFWRKTG